MCAEDLGDLRKVSELNFSVRIRRLTFGARRGLMAGAERGYGGAYGKVSIERLCLSSYVEKPFDSKVIKKFRT